MSLSIVLDSNISISGLLFGGIPEKIVDAGARRHFTSVTSESILAELEAKLSGKFQKSSEEVVSILAFLRRISNLVLADEPVSVCRDPKDNHILECALAGDAAVIVTGDRDLLILHPFRGIRILTPREFYDEFIASPAPQPIP